jgi:SAM-dependent methyltransferase
LTKTAERIAPGRFNTREEYLVYLRHAFAYEYAKSRVKPTDAAVEIGSGEGYGTSLLSQAAARVVGLDIDKATVEHASRKYGSDRVSFSLYDGTTIPLADGSFDVAVSFQVIEHIREDAGHVAEVCRLLKPGGMLILTTPNRNYRLRPGQKPWNRFHIREYAPEELDAVLRRSFPDVSVWGICGSDEVQAIERARVAWALRGGPMAAMRRALPEPVKVLIGAALGFYNRTVKGRSSAAAFTDAYSLDDFHVTHDRVGESLDLLAVCRKPLAGDPASEDKS